MKIGPPPPSATVTRIGAKAYGRTGSAANVARAEDSATILGIPEAEFTPRVRDAIMNLMAEVENLRRELNSTQHRLSELERAADEDPLVPISNRRAFVRELDRALAHTQRYGGSASLIYMDMDGLKQINDRFGHAAGDAAIRKVGEVLLNNLRRSDVVGRLGGDEFGVILMQAEPQIAVQKAELLAKAISAAPILIEGQPVPVTVSYGCHTFAGGEDSQAALAAADRLMYSQKRAKTE